jgi:hypothetical protein
MSNYYEFDIVRGCSFIVYLNVTNSTGGYINLSGYTASGFVISQYTDSGFIYNLAPQCVPPLNSGTIMVSGGAFETSQLPLGGFLYDICIFNSGSDYGLQVVNGDFNIWPSTSNF